MPKPFEPKLDALPAAQREIWSQLRAAPPLGFVLYGGTAVALHLGHRASLDFDLFSAAPLDKARLAASFPFLSAAVTIQEEPQTLIVMAKTNSDAVRVSFFGTIDIGHVKPPLQTADGVLLVASLADLLATKLKATLDRAEAKDYVDIAAMLKAGVPLEDGLGAFQAMFGKDPALLLRALGYFKDGDLPRLPEDVRSRLRTARDRVDAIPEVQLRPGLTG